MRKRFLVRFQVSADSLTWLVIRDGDVLERYCRKCDAIGRAARLARADPPAALVIERMDGTVQATRRYGPGSPDGADPAGAYREPGSTV
ncbi:DUF2188 domain-containing protein [Saccharomonospora amisosensis]|uniref:DUF2188 domain-containing protein n=1 Tax=Saccharomonospora amisosensis TaxID=1128677 RepID=UPI0028BE2783|nr:DUF2188 domain-containing protein [Saccharomonospora amisosensis]